MSKSKKKEAVESVDKVPEVRLPHETAFPQKILEDEVENFLKGGSLHVTNKFEGIFNWYSRVSPEDGHKYFGFEVPDQESALTLTRMAAANNQDYETFIRERIMNHIQQHFQKIEEEEAKIVEITPDDIIPPSNF